MISAGKGRYRVWLKEVRQGDDIILLLGGGEKPHMGSVILCEPEKRTRVINRDIRDTIHKDWIPGKPIAEKVCRKLRRPVLCVAGLHVDDASKEDIEKLKENCKKIEEQL